MAAENRRHFTAVLVNTLIANVTTSFVWFCVTFWMYLETQNVMITAVLGGSYMLGLAVLGVPFGSWVDRARKKRVMVVAQGVTAALFAVAAAVYLLAPRAELLRLSSPWFWVFIVPLLAGAIMESARGIALSTVVTLLVPDEERGRANGLVGMVQGLSFMITSVLAGLAVGQLGMTTSLLLSLVLTVGSLAHMVTVPIPEPTIVHADDAPKRVDFAGAWLAIRAIPGLLALVLFATFNNLLGGVYMALLDPYGLSLMSVEAWGITFALVGLGFLAGGAVVGRRGVGARPLRSLLLANVVMWVVGATFAIRESIPLLVVGMFCYMAIIPLVEAAEQTVLQRVVPLPKQGRVFGFAQSVEVAASPVTAFLVGPVAQYLLIPYMRTDAGHRAWGWLLGDGESRGIALVFLLASLVGLVVTVGALLSRPYRTLSQAYVDAAPAPQQSDGTAHVDPIVPESGATPPGHSR